MKLGVVIDDRSDFIRELLIDWSSRYETEVFSFQDLALPLSHERINRWLRRSAIRQFLHENDVVFFEWAGPTLVEASRLPAKAKIVTRLHSYELYAFASHIQWQAVDRVVLVGRAMERRFHEIFPSEASKTIVICNGVRMDLFQPTYKNHGGVLGMLGSLLPIKRIYEVILAVHELRCRGYDFLLRLGGSPSNEGAENLRYYASLKQIVSKLELEDYVHFDGHIENPEEFLRQIDVFISNSYWESQHVALVEAMASGCFCLGHNWDGIETVLHTDNIYLTNSDLVEKIIDYWNQPEQEKYKRRKYLRDEAVQKFDIDLMKPTFRELIEEMM